MPAMPHEYSGRSSRASGRQMEARRWDLRKLIHLLIGSMLVAAGLELFLVPNQVIAGGFVGISIMLTHFTELKLSLFLFLFNFPFMLLRRRVGRPLLIASLLSLVFVCLGAYLLNPLPALLSNPFLAAVCGGASFGLGMGMIIRFGGDSVDQAEAAVRYLHRGRKLITADEIVLWSNLLILLGAGFVFGWEQALFSLVAYYLAYRMVDVGLYGLPLTKTMWIVSGKREEVERALRAAAIEVRQIPNASEGDKRSLLICTTKRSEEARLTSLLAKADPECMVTAAPNEVNRK